jgi:DNA-binding CsgD family transcriptional regulator
MSTRLISPRFVGRRAELDALRAAVARAREGSSSVVLVSGDAGIGKSRLVAQLASQAVRDGATVLVGECLKLGAGELLYAPIVGALRGLVRECGADEFLGLATAGSDELERVLPELRPTPAGSPREGSQARLFAQLLGVFASVARSGPLLLVIEDLHWSDGATRDFISFFVRSIRAEPIALVLTYRTGDVGQARVPSAFVHELERDDRAVRLRLAPFDRSGIREQVAAIRDEDPDPRLIDRLLARAEGNPFFTEELLAAAGDGSGSLPESLRDALLLRLADRPADVAAIVRSIAVAGRELEHGLLDAVVELPDDRLVAALRDAVGRQVLVHRPGSTKYAFRHALLCEAAYSELLPVERRRTHRLLAEAIEREPELAGSHAAAAAMLSHHWYEAGDLARALRASVDAAAAAEAAYGYAEALVEYERALELWDSVVPEPATVALDRAEVMRRASEAASRAGESDRAIALARAVVESVDPQDCVAAALAHERLARRLWTAGEGVEALVQSRRAVQLMPDRPTAERAMVVAAEAQMLMLSHRALESEPHCEEALAIARALGRRDVEANVLATMCANFSQAGQPEWGVVAAARAREIARELGLVEELARGYLNGSDALDHAGLLDESITLALEGVEVCRELGIARLFGDTILGDVAGRLVRAGEWERAAALLDELFASSPTGISVGNAYAPRAMLEALRGNQERARQAAALAERHVDRTSGSQWRAPVAEARATAELWSGRPEEAARTLDACLATVADGESVLTTVRLYELAVRAAADVALKDVGVAVGARPEWPNTRIAELLERVDGLIACLPCPAPLGVRASRQSAAAEASRIAGGDPQAWDAAARLWGEYRDRHHQAYARWRHAEALLLEGGDRRAAQDSARRAYAIAAELGARPLAEAIEALARRGRLDLGDDRGDGGAVATGSEAVARLELTPRELEVFALLGEGMTNREIAAELFITGKTASVHVSRILAKLSVSNRAAAAAAAQRLGVERVGASVGSVVQGAITPVADRHGR